MYTLGAITFGAAGVQTVDQLEDVTVDHALQHVMAGIAGGVDTEMITNMGQAPTFQFTSTDLKALLDICFMDGYVIDAGVPDSELITYWRKYADGGVFDTGSNHLRGTINKAFMILDSLQAQVGQPATATFKVIILHDLGATDPILWESPVAYSPSHSGAGIDNLWTLGKAWINSNADGDFLPGLQSWRLNTGIEVATRVEAGSIYPVQAWINKRNPVIELQCQDMSLLDTDLDEKLAGMKGLAIDSDGARVFLQKCAKGADLVPETGGAETHIKILVTEGVAMVQRFDGRVTETTPINVEIKPSKSDSAETLVLDTTSFITVAA